MRSLRCGVVVGGVLAAVVSLTGTASSQAVDGEQPEQRVVRAESDPRDPVGAVRTYAELMAMPSVDDGYVPRTRAPGETPAACPRGRCRDYRVPVPRGVKVNSSKVRVLLPTGYASRPKQRYPVVYLLNGAKSAYWQWSRSTEIVQMSRRLPAIIVMPDGGYRRNAGMFSDWKDGSFDWETFHVKVLVPWIDRHFRTNRQRAVGGASMGGMGALLYAARNPRVFRSALSISGVVDTNLLVGNAMPPAIYDELGLSQPNLERVWGSSVLDRGNWDAHNPTSLAPRLKGTDLYVASGTGFPSVATATGDSVHSGASEALLWNGHRTFLAALTAAEVPYHAYVWQGGVHSWAWFDGAMRWALPRMVAGMRR